MIQRYANAEIERIFSSKNKVALWQRTELAVIKAVTNIYEVDDRVYHVIAESLKKNPCDLDWWIKRDNEIHHDLQAWVEERLRWIPDEYKRYWHEGMTSYDTEEPAFAQMLKDAGVIVHGLCAELEGVLIEMARRYRHTPMMARTHGQWADLQTQGKRCLTWLQDLRAARDNFHKSLGTLDYSRIAGAVGNFTGVSPDVEQEALRLMDFKPFYGSTQIMPRILYSPFANALAGIAQQCDKIAHDIRLGARSGYTIYREPFGRQQKGSSAMPHKKNTILCENIQGMATMATGYNQMIQQTIKTWEERSIDQSSVERVAWPDLFHVVCRALTVLHRVLSGLAVYPNVMLREIIDSRGCYAASVAKEELEKMGAPHGLTPEECYRIVQLAAFNAMEVVGIEHEIRVNPPTSLEIAQDYLRRGYDENEPIRPSIDRSIQSIIYSADLRLSSEVDVTKKDIESWHHTLVKIFNDQTNARRWDEIFSVPYLLRNEETLYKEILGE